MVCSNAVADSKQIHTVSIKSGYMSRVWPSSIEFPGRHSRSTEVHGSVSTKCTGFAKYQEVVGADVYVTSNHLSGLDQILTSGIPEAVRTQRRNGDESLLSNVRMQPMQLPSLLPLAQPGNHR